MDRLRKAKNYIIYAGIDQETFRRIAPDILEENRRNLRVFSMLAAVTLCALIIAAAYDEMLVKNRMAYLCAMTSCLGLYGLSWASVRYEKLLMPAVYGFVEILFAFGIVLGTVIEPEEMTASYAILLFAAPLLFTDSPLRMSLAILISLVAYFTMAVRTQNPVILNYNTTNMLTYGTLSMICSSYMMYIKVARLVLEQKNRYLSERDQLTGLLNRHSFEQHLKHIRSGQSAEVTVCAFDVNGLKKVNDGLGHAAGDELLCGAAAVIRRVFGSYGRCYRTGGDEFIALLEGPAPDSQELLAELADACAQWCGNLVKELSVSAGVIPMRPGAALDELLQEADMAMYAQKAAYYERLRSSE